MASVGAIFTSTYHTKQLNPWPTLLASCVVIYIWLSAYPGEVEPFIDHLSTYGHLTNLRNKLAIANTAWATLSSNTCLIWLMLRIM